MNVNIDIKLMEGLDEGVIFLNRSGHILDFNSAARPYLKPCFNAAEKIAHLIGDGLSHKVNRPTPVTFLEVGPGQTGPVDVHLCSNALSDFMLLITRRATSAVSPLNADSQPITFALLGDEIRHEMTHLREQIAYITAQSTAPDFAPVIASSERLSRFFVALDQLASLCQGESFLNGKRISLTTLIHEVLAELPRHRCDFAINQVLSDTEEHRGLLYGDQVWLKSGLKGLLEAIVDSGPPGCQVELRLRQSGSYLVFTGGFMNATVPSSGSFHRPGHQRNLTIGTQIDLRIPIARRIFERHGGQLKITEMDSDNPDEFNRGIDSFTLSLPTGASNLSKRSSACDDCPVTRQAEAYAHDLASLIPTDHKDSEVTQEELTFLRAVMSTHAS